MIITCIENWYSPKQCTSVFPVRTCFERGFIGFGSAVWWRL